MPPGDDASVEMSNPILGGIKINKVSPAMLTTIFTIFGFVVACIIAWVLWIHHVQAGEEKTSAEKNAKLVAEALKDSNKLMADTLKESNSQTIKAIERLTDATREIACLSDPAMKNRQDAREVCRRLSIRNGYR